MNSVTVCVPMPGSGGVARVGGAHGERESVGEKNDGEGLSAVERAGAEVAGAEPRHRERITGHRAPTRPLRVCAEGRRRFAVPRCGHAAVPPALPEAPARCPGDRAPAGRAKGPALGSTSGRAPRRPDPRRTHGGTARVGVAPRRGRRRREHCVPACPRLGVLLVPSSRRRRRPSNRCGDPTARALSAPSAGRDAASINRGVGTEPASCRSARAGCARARDARHRTSPARHGRPTVLGPPRPLAHRRVRARHDEVGCPVPGGLLEAGPRGSFASARTVLAARSVACGFERRRPGHRGPGPRVAPSPLG